MPAKQRGQQGVHLVQKNTESRGNESTDVRSYD
jgi:hypothetical protein